MAAVNAKKTIDVIGGKVAALTTVPLTLTLSKKNGFKVTAKVVYTDGSDTVTATVCANNGKIREFSNVDDVILAFAKAAPGCVTITTTMNVEELNQDFISLDPAKQLIRDKAKNKANLDRQTAVVAKLDELLTAIGAYDGGNAAQQAVYDGVAAERAIANELKVFYAALPQP